MLILLLLFTFLSPSFTSVDSFNFSFPSFDFESCTNGGNLICSGSATASNGTLNVTSDHQQQQPRDPPSTNQIGRVLYKYPVIGWPAYICTTFSIRILTDPNSEGAGDGMAFVLAQDVAPSPPNSFGSFLGIFDQSTQGTPSETHQVLAWNFTCIELPNKSLGPGNNLGVKLAVPVISGLLFLAILALPFVLRALRIRKERLARKVDIEMMIAAANGPRLFPYKKLSKATRNFSKDNLLGTGGFGSVYKGVMSKPPTTIAVKKINATSKQGEKEYLAENLHY
ncbi:L-type lectin-domain containing receptor kinase IX.2-like isoform X2 [Camellia sinensis]|uniref:L-type lectin-domain containing receptor kinase IX.2-like isoform X2 n=1 Tax=Camellia sinensis TaxID=4442 RepID=UPI001036B0CE|nr:L-type lectin-domain containing receptor kinase IX.2-like isoform X2 [Camellia sinensis]